MIVTSGAGLHATLVFVHELPLTSVVRSLRLSDGRELRITR
jgi:hypothetical protein